MKFIPRDARDLRSKVPKLRLAKTAPKIPRPASRDKLKRETLRIPPYQKLRPAAVGDPDAVVVVAPGLALDAGGVAELARQRHAECRIGGAMVVIAVRRLANDRRSRGRRHWSKACAADYEFAAATVPDP